MHDALHVKSLAALNQLVQDFLGNWLREAATFDLDHVRKSSTVGILLNEVKVVTSSDELNEAYYVGGINHSQEQNFSRHGL